MNKSDDVISISRRQPGCDGCVTKKYCFANHLDSNCLGELQAIISRHHRLKKGERLFDQGHKFYSLFLVQSGSVKAYVINEDGDHQITNFYFPGELLDIDGIEDGVQSYGVEALETSSLCEFDFETFVQFAHLHPLLHCQFLRALGRGSAREKQHLLVLGKMQAEQKLANFILDIAEQKKRRGQSDIRLHFSMSRNDIANYLGLAVETVSRVLSRFDETKMIQIKRRAVEILDREKLRLTQRNIEQPMLWRQTA